MSSLDSLLEEPSTFELVVVVVVVVEVVVVVVVVVDKQP